MTKAVLGVIGGSGVYDLPGIEDVREERVASPWGEPSDVLRIGRIAGTDDRLPAPPRARPPPVAVGHQLPRQYRRHEAGRRHRPRLGLGLRLVQGRAAIPGCSCSSTSSSTARTGARARSSATAASPMSRWRIRSGRGCRSASPRRRAAEGIACRRGGTYVCMEGPQFSSLRRVAHLQGPRLRRDRHDGDARGQARPRGRDHLRHHRHGDRLRLLAPRARRGRGLRRSSRC